MFDDDRDTTASAEPHRAEAAKPSVPATKEARLSALTTLASLDIETTMVSSLSGSLHSLFDDICDKTLPIYFGPLLGRLYLEGL